MKTLLLKALRKAYRSATKKQFPRWSWPSDEEWIYANDTLFHLLSQESPCFVGRIGTVEGAIVHNKICIPTPPRLLNKVKGCWGYITDNARMPWWDTGRPFLELQKNAGFFAKGGVTLELVDRFAEMYLHYIPVMDVCGRFEHYEQYLPFSPSCKMVQLESLYPFFSDRPWTKTLEGKNVLVVHPFKHTIEKQYAKRKSLFANNDILPDFNLKVIKAVQSIAGESTPYNDWFEALDSMKTAIAGTDFDVAILGCGAYGLPLAGFIKEELGKKAIHMGGGTQLMFGIKGRRWTVDYKNSCYRDLYNEHWVSPEAEERPTKASQVEGGCYW